MASSLKASVPNSPPLYIITPRAEKGSSTQNKTAKLIMDLSTLSVLKVHKYFYLVYFANLIFFLHLDKTPEITIPRTTVKLNKKVKGIHGINYSYVSNRLS